MTALRSAIAERDIDRTRGHLLPKVLDLLQRNVRVRKMSVPFAPQLPEGPRPFLVPAPETYGEQSWKWDLVFGAQVAARAAQLLEDPRWAKTAAAIAVGSTLAAFQGQVTSGSEHGMVPHMGFRGGRDAELWKHPTRSALTQPVVTPMAVRALEPELRAALYPAVVAELEWWLRERLVDDLPAAIHPWETGRDASRDHDSQLLPYLESHPATLALQTANPGHKDERSKRGRFALLEALQRDAEDPATLSFGRSSERYCMRSPDMAAWLVLALRDGAALAREAGEEARATEFELSARRVACAVNARMWHEDFYYSLGRQPDPELAERVGLSAGLVAVDEAGRIQCRLGTAFITLVAGIPNDEQARALLAALESPGFATATALPTVAADDPGYRSDDYWRGSVWVNVNAFVVRGLVDYGERFAARGHPDARRFFAAAERIGWQTVEATAEGFFEYYDAASPSTRARSQGPDSFTWSALSLNVLDTLARLPAARPPAAKKRSDGSDMVLPAREST